MHLQQLKVINYNYRYVNGVPFVNRSYMKGEGSFSVKNGIIYSGKGLDLWMEPLRI